MAVRVFSKASWATRAISPLDDWTVSCATYEMYTKSLHTELCSWDAILALRACCRCSSL